MFFDEYPKDKLASVWREFARIKQSYTPDERWKEIIDKSYKNAAFTELTMDNIIYNFYKNTYTEEDEHFKGSFICTAMMLILAKKTTIDYGVEMNIPDYEFSTYLQTTRLCTVFERTRDFSEQQDNFAKYEEKIKEIFPNNETTLWALFNNQEMAEDFHKFCNDTETGGVVFIDTFTNILAFDFVRNYMNLPNERNLNGVYDEDYSNTVEEHDYPKQEEYGSCEGTLYTEQEPYEPCDNGI